MTDTNEDITEIRFADQAGIKAYVLTRGMFGACIEDMYTWLEIASKEDAQNLIKALEKAIELGWWK